MTSSAASSVAQRSDPVARRRTFAIISHPDAGKTTLTEKLLLFGGAIQLAGEVRAKANRRQTRSDWMGIEKERGISVVTSVMTFEYGDCVYNLLDTPGHEDFSEDTYRTLTAVDSAIMVLDAARGIEARTRKLFEVCRLRDIPIVTFINKLDRETRDPFELLDEIEKTLALEVAPVTWPLGQGRGFVGTYDLAKKEVRRLDHDAEAVPVSGPDDPYIEGLMKPADFLETVEQIELASDGLKKFDRKSFLEGHMTPVFFGSALRNFGIRDLIDALAEFAPAPQGLEAASRKVDAHETKMTGFVFKIQANMDKNHRDRIAFMRICSGKLVARHEGQARAHRQDDRAEFAAVLLRAGSPARRGGLAGRRRRHPQPRHAAHRRHPDRGRGPGVSRRAELRAGDPATGEDRRFDEAEEAARGARPDGGGRAWCSSSSRPTARKPWSASSARCNWTC